MVRSKEIRVCFEHVKYEMPIKHPSGGLKEEVNMHVDPRVGRDQHFQPRFLSFYIRESGLGILGVPDNSLVAKKDTETQNKVTLRKGDVWARDAF